MKKGLFAVSCAVIIFFPCAAAYADFAQLTLGKAIDVALANNGELAALRQEMGLREASRIRAGLWPNPEVELEGAYADASEYVISAGISQEILTGGKLRKRVTAAEQEAVAYAHELRDAERRLEEEVKGAYWDAVFAEMALELTDRTIGLNGELLLVAKERFMEGDIPELELALAEVELARAEQRKLEAQSALVAARASLFTHMDVPDEGFELAVPPLIFPDSGPEELKAFAISNRPDIMALAAAAEKADAEYEAASAERWPNVTASLFYVRENAAIESGSEELNDQDNFFGLRLSIPMPLFDRNQAGMIEARTNKGAAVTRKEFLEGKVVKEVELACRRLELAKAGMDIYGERIMPQAGENLSLMQEAYRLGEVGILNIVEEQRKFVELSEKHLLSRREAAKALAALEAAVGANVEGGGI